MELKQQFNEILQKSAQNYNDHLMLTLPSGVLKKCFAKNKYETFSRVLEYASQNDEECDQFLQEIGIDLKLLQKIEGKAQRHQYILKSFTSSIENTIQKINVHVNNYTINSSKQQKLQQQKTKKSKFGWLKLKSKHPMLQQKLKAKLIRTLNEGNNQKKVREYIRNGKQNEQFHLDREQATPSEQETPQIGYQWSVQDEKKLMENIKSLKHQYNTTQFLKQSRRHKFVTSKEYQTIASEEISHKLYNTSEELKTQHNYYSSAKLSQKEMRYLLKNSPYLTKYVDKKYIQAAVRTIPSGEIDNLELQIADQVIKKWSNTRQAIRKSRQKFNCSKSQVIRQRIAQFEHKKQASMCRKKAINQMKQHIIANKKALGHKGKNKSYIPNAYAQHSERVGNRFHPSSCLFVKDCNEQCNDDINNSYQQQFQEEKMRNHKKVDRVKLINFYSGGPDENIQNTFNQSQDDISVICKAIKSLFYQKQMLIQMQNIQISPRKNVDTIFRSITPTLIRNTSIMPANQTKLRSGRRETLVEEATIAQRLQIESKMMIINAKKLLLLASENAWLGMKDLNIGEFKHLIDSRDSRGNTALYYAVKHRNFQMVDHLLSHGAITYQHCQSNNTPLHLAFKSNNIQLICRCLISPDPNLNALNDEKKTPLAYCSRQILELLRLQEGVVSTNKQFPDFNNNSLLVRQSIQKLYSQAMELSYRIQQV